MVCMKKKEACEILAGRFYDMFRTSKYPKTAENDAFQEALYTAMHAFEEDEIVVRKSDLRTGRIDEFDQLILALVRKYGGYINYSFIANEVLYGENLPRYRYSRKFLERKIIQSLFKLDHLRYIQVGFSALGTDAVCTENERLDMPDLAISSVSEILEPDMVKKILEDDVKKFFKKLKHPELNKKNDGLDLIDLLKKISESKDNNDIDMLDL